MKKLVIATMLATTTSLAALVAAAPAIAAPHRQQQQERSFETPVVSGGHYDGARELRIDTNDRASSPYAGGAG
jgi:hypothetical protein